MSDSEIKEYVDERLRSSNAKLDQILTELKTVKRSVLATSTGVERRSQIDTETVKALLLINGGGAIALLTLLPSVLATPKLKPLASAILVGVLLFMVGLICAVLHNRYRRKCSLTYDQHGLRPPAEAFFGYNLRKPKVCWISEKLMLASIICFFAAGCYVAIMGLLMV